MSSYKDCLESADLFASVKKTGVHLEFSQYQLKKIDHNPICDFAAAC